MADGFNPAGVVRPFGAFSNAAWVSEGRLLYISGQVAIDEDGNIVGKGDFRAQTQYVLDLIGRILADAGGTFDDVVSVNVFLPAMTYLEACHEVRRLYFKQPFPSSTLVQVTALVRPELMIEVNAVAAIRPRRPR
mgnify:CR=1 FL=1